MKLKFNLFILSRYVISDDVQECLTLYEREGWNLKNYTLGNKIDKTIKNLIEIFLMIKAKLIELQHFHWEIWHCHSMAHTSNSVGFGDQWTIDQKKYKERISADSYGGPHFILWFTWCHLDSFPPMASDSGGYVKFFKFVPLNIE